MSKVVAGLRPGGRSARIQEAVHQAVLDLQASMDHTQMTIPLIAKQAGVTPSTIYRRWGCLATLLSDVALAKLQPDSMPQDYGSFQADLTAWFEQYFEEYSSEVGHHLLVDISSNPESDDREQCYELVSQQLQVIIDRAKQRNEPYIEVQLIIEIIISPLIYMILFSRKQLEMDYAHQLLNRLFEDYL